MGREEILLREYEACQSHNNTLGNQSWISISILITVNLLLLGQVVLNLVLTSDPASGYGRLVLVMLLAILMIIIMAIFWRWYKRITFQVLLNNERMRDIENILNMFKNWRVYGLDLIYGRNRNERQSQEVWDALYPHQKAYLEGLNQRLVERGGEWQYKRPTTKGFPKFKCIFPTFISIWVLIILLECLIYKYSFVRDFLIN